MLSESEVRSIQFKINHDDAGKVSGFTLMGVGDTYAEAFCLSFLTAQQKGKGKVGFEESEVNFVHYGVSSNEADKRYGIYGTHPGGTFSATIAPEECAALDDLLHRRGDYVDMQIRVRPELAWGKGFTLYVAH